MILINNEEINLGYSEKSTPIETIIKAKIKTIKESFKGRFPLEFSLHPKLITKGSITDSAGGQPREIPIYPFRPIKLSQSVIIEGERVMLTYCKRLVYNKAKDEYRPDMKNLSLTEFGRLNVIEHDADLAFFLLYVHANVENALDCIEIKRDIKDERNREYFYKFVDEHKAAMESVQKDKAKVKIQSIIYNDMTDEIVKAMSIRYNIVNAETKDTNVLRIELFNKIVSTAATAHQYENVYGEFEAKYRQHLPAKTGEVAAKVADEVKKSEPEPEVEPEKPFTRSVEDEATKELRLKSLITAATNAGIIRASGLNSKNVNYHYWCFIDEDGKNGNRICAIIDKDATDSIYKALLVNENDIVKNLETKVLAYNKKVNSI